MNEHIAKIGKQYSYLDAVFKIIDYNEITEYYSCENVKGNLGYTQFSRNSLIADRMKEVKPQTIEYEYW